MGLWRKVGGAIVSVFFFSCVHREGREWATDVTPHQHLGMGACRRDRDVGKSVSRCYVSGFDSCEMSSALLHQGGENLTRVCRLTKFMLVHPQAQECVAKLGPQSDPTCSAFHLMRHSMSSAGLEELAVKSPICIWAR